jgi:lipopolysaccharide/colanic/teichoic acid biosynthesis glycosyltransferase
MLKRLFDIFFSAIGLILLSPVFLIMAIWIKCDSYGPIFYKQTRVGKNGRNFLLYKFRSMGVGSDKKGLLTVGEKDPRITRSGKFIRKFKLDEFPQLINVLRGEMSIVGPRPEVPKYVALYSEEQKKVLKIRPGISDWSSIRFSSENELLAQAENSEDFYISEIMPEKLKMNLEYVSTNNFWMDVKIIFMTLKKLISRG